MRTAEALRWMEWSVEYQLIGGVPQGRPEERHQLTDRTLTARTTPGPIQFLVSLNPIFSTQAYFSRNQLPLIWIVDHRYPNLAIWKWNPQP